MTGQVCLREEERKAIPLWGLSALAGQPPAVTEGTWCLPSRHRGCELHLPGVRVHVRACVQG